ncbi:Hypothetical protein, putative [Bodo saltans]|uniref:Uncharacterized protein n=1 Tax=Bodo saltans TaxID=75058 RepID=A0A0S4IM17_BODSA|nr:Hypothetical protein, putative [Bodo saltans]|eukprot:CUF35789.1 Hypothetical protein, putative [Bodo saltans]
MKYQLCWTSSTWLRTTTAVTEMASVVDWDFSYLAFECSGVQSHSFMNSLQIAYMM